MECAWGFFFTSIHLTPDHHRWIYPFVYERREKNMKTRMRLEKNWKIYCYRATLIHKAMNCVACIYANEFQFSRTNHLKLWHIRFFRSQWIELTTRLYIHTNTICTNKVKLNFVIWCWFCLFNAILPTNLRTQKYGISFG